MKLGKEHEFQVTIAELIVLACRSRLQDGAKLGSQDEGCGYGQRGEGGVETL